MSGIFSSNEKKGVEKSKSKKAKQERAKESAKNNTNGNAMMSGGLLRYRVRKGDEESH